MPPKGKDKTKTPSQPPPSVEDLFTKLNKHIKDDHLQQAIKLADQVLAIAPGDEDALRCKVVALIKADSVEDALTVIRGCKNSAVDFSYYKAYCLYRLNKLDEALESIKGHDGDAAAMLLESQIMYRVGKMDASVEIYQRLQKSKIENLEINFVASLVSSGRPSEVESTLNALRVKATSSFELAYNTACSLVESNRLKDAEELLLSARRIGQETLTEENLAEDDIEFELAPVAVQLAYVQQLLGNKPEAVGAYAGIISKKLADESSLAVALNNIVALKGPKDVPDSLRKFDRLKDKDSQNFQLANELSLKLSPKQKETIYANRVLLLLNANKLDLARELVRTLQEMFVGSVIPVLLQAALFVKENKAGKAEEVLGQFAEKFPDKSKVVLLARAQVAAAANHPHIAADSLVKIPDIQHMPATVATLVALKERAGDIDGAATVIDTAIKWWSNAMTEDNKLSLIMQEAASFMVKHGRADKAAHLYEELVKTHRSMEVLAGLVSTVAHVDIDRAEMYEKQLKPLPGLKGVDVDSLEKTSGAKHIESTQDVGVSEYEERKSKEKAKKKRKRKPRYPKGFDPANPGPPPDPERWLPKRERSTYRPKRKDKRAAQVRGSQGAAGRERPELDVAGSSSSNSNSKATQATTSKAEPQNAGGQSKTSSKSSKKKSRR